MLKALATYPECGSPRAVAIVVLTGGVGQMVQPTYFVRQSRPLCISNSIPVKGCGDKRGAARYGLINHIKYYIGEVY